MDDLTRDAILGADDLPIEQVEVPEWNGSVYMRTLTGKQRDDFEQFAVERKTKTGIDIRGMRIKLIAMCLCDKDGKMLFAGRDDESKLIQKSGAALQRLSDVAQRLSGLDDNEMKEIVSDFGDGPIESSGSD